MGKNYNYVFLFYDVGEKRVNKVFKVCKKYLNHHQNSVFRGEISPSKIIALKREIKKIIKKEEDFVTIIKMYSKESFEEETIGKYKSFEEDLIL
ncbi:CRISPR-associated endonuclease Cas2 [Anaerococcus vaginalis]|uniref:CRISPR-associated endonuclease Cas2 n=1 Tax=Anaerococcus vaginalis TaxID=33037 RepID=UPI00242F52F9|nr:CRISPR-associated endonuclease Cas2 [Anaerococcus vaginalis]MDU5252383.1 CRISPR-associated endonuclease Cas2 [Anaerococcus vaginalis]MDU5988330.1 CRISPR-associated endonuclease Cas2 [Anaerococcus vaginalis]MDU6781588.1 CRISPR-associated endonuclease Cas2 [Anaerococcus vaginalis]